MASPDSEPRSSVFKGDLVIQNTNNHLASLSVNSSDALLIKVAQTAPGAATVALAGTGATGVSPAGVRFYKITLVTSAGETEGGTASSSVTPSITDATVSLSSIPTGSANIVTARRVYRTRAGNGVTDRYFLVAEIADNTTTTYSDVLADAGLGVEMPVLNTTSDQVASISKAGAITSVAGMVNTSITDSGLTSGRVVIASTGGLLADDGDLTFSGDTLSATKVASSSLTSGRVPVASTAGLLIDDAGLSYAASRLTATNATISTQLSIGATDLNLARLAASNLAVSGATGASINLKQATASVTAAVGATVVATSLVPAKAIVRGVVTRITTGLGAGTGTTGYQVGDGSDADRWGVEVGVASGGTTGSADYTADPRLAFSTSAQSITLTATGGDFDGTGVIRVIVLYEDFTAPTS